MTEQNGLERSSATDELRRLLDERGVEWQDFDDEPTWMGSDGEMHYARQEFTFNGLTGNVTVYHLTPEQAIEATLGSDLKAENAKLRELVRDLWLAGSLCDAIPAMRLQAKGGDWRTMQERVDAAMGIEVDGCE